MATDKNVTVETQEEISLEAFKKMRKTSSSGNWKQDIISYLRANQGCKELELYAATRQDRMDISESKKKHNLASQYTYLRDEGYLVKKEDSKVFLLTEVKNGKIYKIKGMEHKF